MLAGISVSQPANPKRGGMGGRWRGYGGDAGDATLKWLFLTTCLL